ncbi:MAG: hypothetical protein GY795_14310 [Desulfobacterales bacterium]|nr:hypothetical protein [Desulfobacterales bacterium]
MKKLPLQIALVVVLLGFLLTGTAFFSYIFFKKETHRMKESVNENIKNTYNLFNFLIEEEKDGLVKVLTVLARMDVLPEYLAKKDKDTLMALSLPFFEKLKKNFRITHLYFIEPDGSVLLRVHKPEQYGDILNRITYNRAKKTGKISTGIEMGKNFFSLRAIQPVEYQGHSAGYIEIGMEIDHIFLKVKKLSQNEISLFLSDEFVRSKTVQISGQKVKGFSLLESSSKDAAVKTALKIENLEQGMKRFVSVELKFGENHVLASISPFKDAAGEIAGVLMIYHDYTLSVSGLAREFRVNTFVFLAGVLAFFSVALAVLKKIMKYRLFKPVIDTIKGLVSSSHEVSTASEHLSSSSLYLAHETVKMTDNTRDIYSFSNHLAAMTKQNTVNTSQSDVLMKNTVRIVEKAKNHISELNNSVTEISKSGHETKGIVRTIDEVAFQTRLLALNAAVEAARVGESGAGFAVVADEVKKLSQRVSDAAKNTADLVENMICNIESGAGIVQKVSLSFDEVFTETDRCRTLIDEIASMDTKRSEEIEQINSKLAGMEEVSQALSSNTEQFAAVSEDLNRQSEGLQEYVQALAKIIGVNNQKERV